MQDHLMILVWYNGVETIQDKDEKRSSLTYIICVIEDTTKFASTIVLGGTATNVLVKYKS